MGSLSLLQGIFLTQGLNPGLPHCRQILYQLSHKASLRMFKLLHNCTHFTWQQSNAQNSLSQASTVREPRTSICPTFRKGRGTRDQIANIRWIIEKAREFQKNIYFCFIDYAKAFDCVDHNKLENSSRDGNARPPYLLPEKSVYRSRSNS